MPEAFCSKPVCRSFNESDSPQSRKERKALCAFINKFLCELCVFAVKTMCMDEHKASAIPAGSDSLNPANH
jgi:hypothetical protein